ncbi:MAG TPA: hypothetical protein VFN49_03510 [Candidatus Aquilonibacter sp.]|nr:hypothetical protein [Candidatus Aquilonibacter sp.]
MDDTVRKNAMMRHLIDALESGEDIGHYGRLVFVMVGRYFAGEDELVELLCKGADCDEKKARALILQVSEHDYNPPSRQKIAEFQAKQAFPILPHDDPGEGNVYKDLEFPAHVYDRIEEYYEERV